MRSLDNCYEDIISEESLWFAWKLFRRGKRKRADVRMFERRLEKNLLALRHELKNETYRHGQYRQFTVHDPKQRLISAPQIRDQIVHQAIWNILFPHFDHRFSSAVHSCRPGRGTHSAVLKIRQIGRRLAGRGKVWILHLDVIKFFDSVEHEALRKQIGRGLSCPRTLPLLNKIIDSYQSGPVIGRGIPLGNLTSQLFCNIILMPIDRWIENGPFGLTYARYADDLFVIGNDRQSLEEYTRTIIGKFAAIGLRCRFRVVRYDGFEALGKRFFHDGLAIKRGTAIRATHKLMSRVELYTKDVIGTADIESVFSSFLGLSQPANDPRWRKKIGESMLKIHKLNGHNNVIEYSPRKL